MLTPPSTNSPTKLPPKTTIDGSSFTGAEPRPSPASIGRTTGTRIPTPTLWLGVHRNTRNAADAENADTPAESSRPPLSVLHDTIRVVGGKIPTSTAYSGNPAGTSTKKVMFRSVPVCVYRPSATFIFQLPPGSTRTIAMGLHAMFADHIETTYNAIINESEPRSAVVASCDAVIIELNIVAHQIPAYVDTGNKLWGWFYSVYRPYLESFKRPMDDDDDAQPRKFMVFVADNYEKVPHEKFEEQSDRSQSSARALAATKFAHMSKDDLSALDVTDEFCPANVQINASSALLFKIIVYLIGRLTVGFASETRCAAYATCPSRKGSSVGEGFTAGPLHVSYASGQHIRLTKIGPDPPGPFVHGEGEVEAWLWTRVLRTWNAPRILIKSIDNDNIGIALAVPRSCTGGVFVELKSREYDKPSKKNPGRLCIKGTKTRRYLDCGALAASIPDKAEALSLLFVAIVAGSDFCRGKASKSPISGVSIGTLIPVYEQLRERRLCIQRPEHTHVTGNVEKITEFLETCIQQRRRERPKAHEADTIKQVIASAMWNINYWASIFNE